MSDFHKLQARAKELGIKPLTGRGVDTAYLRKRVEEAERDLDMARGQSASEKRPSSPRPSTPTKETSQTTPPKSSSTVRGKIGSRSPPRKSLSFSEVFLKQRGGDVETLDLALQELNDLERSASDTDRAVLEEIFSTDPYTESLERLLRSYNSFGLFAERLPNFLSVLAQDNSKAAGILFASGRLDLTTSDTKANLLDLIPFVRTADQALTLASLLTVDNDLLSNLFDSWRKERPLSAIGLALILAARGKTNSLSYLLTIDQVTFDAITVLSGLPTIAPGELFNAVYQYGTPDDLKRLIISVPLLRDAELGYRVVYGIPGVDKAEEEKIALLGALEGGGYEIEGKQLDRVLSLARRRGYDSIVTWATD